MKSSRKEHKDRNRYKKRIKRSGQAQVVYVKDINRNVPITRDGEPMGRNGIKDGLIVVLWSIDRLVMLKSGVRKSRKHGRGCCHFVSGSLCS